MPIKNAIARSQQHEGGGREREFLTKTPAPFSNYFQANETFMEDLVHFQL